jgi:carbon starvation protein
MLSLESHARPIGYGAMLIESFVGVMALIAASILYPGDYFAINVSPEKFQMLGLQPVNLQELSQAVGENVAGRPGGAVSLAVGMAQIFAGLPGLKHLIDYWYHFAIMFEALFILTTIDTGTRVGRFLLQELLARAPSRRVRRLGDPAFVPGAVLSSVVIVLGWAAFIWSGEIATIWPMFGVANQLLASVALAIGTTILLREAKHVRYALITFLPLLFVGTTTLTAGVRSTVEIYWKMAQVDATRTMGLVCTGVTSVLIVCVVIILSVSGREWARLLRSRRAEASTTAA